MVLTKLVAFVVAIETTYRIAVNCSSWENGTEFQIPRLKGSMEFFNYEKSKSSHCVYDDIRKSLICMGNHSYDVMTSWHNRSENIVYLRLNCLPHEQNFNRNETCVCKNMTVMDTTTTKLNGLYHSCYLEKVRHNMFSDLINVKVIDLSFNKIRTIDARSLENCTALEYLILNHNPISSYPYEMLCGLSRLNFLDFSHQLLTYFPNNIFNCGPESHSSVLVFNISYCRIVEIADNSFKYLNNLLLLDMRGNMIEIISDNVFKGASSLDYVDFSDNKLNQIPKSFCRHLVKLKYFLLQKNRFEFINMTHLQNCDNLEILDFSDNLLASLEGTQNPMTSLKSLKLRHNRLVNISTRMRLKYLPFISELDLSWNLISSIEDTSFDGIKNIHKLDLSSNKLTITTANFHRIFQNFHSLRYLNLSSNYFISCSNLAFDELGSLKELDLSYNSIENLTDASFTGLINLTSLKLNHNKMDSIHEFSFTNLNSLKSIDLSYNILASLESIHFPDILILDTSWNKLEYIPSHLPVSLSRVLLTGNRISSVRRDDLKGLVMLNELNLSHNLLTLLEKDSFSSLCNITSVDLSFNNLSLIFQKDIFKGFKQIRSLILNHNNITSIDKILQFDSLITLQILDVSYNKIDQLKESLNPTGAPRQLTFLDLEGCGIRFIFKSAFVNLPFLKIVNLQNNMIMDIPLFDAPVYTEFLLKVNPLVCFCNMSWLVDNLSNTSTMNYDVDVCRTFPHGWSRPIQTLSKDQFLCPVVECPEKCSCYSKKENGTAGVTVCTGELETIPSGIPKTSLTIYLDGNNFSELGTIAALFTTQISVKRLFANNSRILGIASTIFKNTARLEELNLSYNSIKILPANVFHGLRFLKVIHLQHNQIRDLPNALFSDLKALKSVDVSSNQLAYLRSQYLKQLDNMEHFRWINLGSNPWRCDCSNKALRIWLQETSAVTKKRNIFCNNEEMLRVPLDQFDCPSVLSESSKIGLICLLAIILALSKVICIAYYRKTLMPVLYRRFGMRCLKRKQISKSDVILYDVIVLVDDKDHKCVWWVKNSLVPKLTEQKRKFRIYVPEPSVEGGEMTIKTVYKINQSYATLILASKHFQDNYWCVECSRHAYSLVRCKNHSVVLLLWGNINVYNLDSEIREQIERGDHLYIKDNFFWDKLMYKLPSPSDRGNISSLCKFKNTKEGEVNTGFVVERGS